MTWYCLFGDVVQISEPALPSSRAANDAAERKWIEDAQAAETSLSGQVAKWVRAFWAKRPEMIWPRPVTPKPRPVAWQKHMLAR